MVEACELNSVSEEDYLELGRAGLGSCLLGGLPNWVVAYSARLVCLLDSKLCFWINVSCVLFVFFRGAVDYLTYILTKLILGEGEVHKSRKDKTS